MRREIGRVSSSGKPLNTLAQTGTRNWSTKVTKPVITVKGNGSDTENEKRQTKRAKSKMISQKLMLCLIDVAISKGERERTQPYWNTYHCQSRIISAGGRLYGDYCKNRFCTVCSGNRKAEIINKYLPEIQTWGDPHFVTLTAKAVAARSLNKRVADMLRGFRILTERYKKQYSRGTGSKLIGIKSLECNFNPERRTYNPHIHVIVATGEMADKLVTDWLGLMTDRFANRVAQNIRRVEDTERDLVEIIKYGTKIFTDPTMKKKAKASPYVYVSAFDNIIAAMNGHRIFDRFGFNLPKVQKLPGGKRTRLTEYKELVYDPHLFDWMDSETEKLLSGYVPTRELVAIFESNIDTKLE